MPEAVNSNANKILLAQILQNHPLASANNVQFQQLIVQEINQIHRQRFQFHSDLTVMNKEVIKRITEIGKKMSVPRKKPVLPPAPPVSKNFESRLKEQQDNFLKLANPSKPKDIDFSDNLTEGSIPTMDSTLQQREKELRAIMKDYQDDTTAKQWIENEAVNAPSKIENNIIIDAAPAQPIQPDPLPITPQKRVTFEINEKEESSTVSFLSKLKKKENPLSTIQEEIASPVSTTHTLLKESIELQNKTLIAIEQLTIFLQNQFSQSLHPDANIPSK